MNKSTHALGLCFPPGNEIYLVRYTVVIYSNRRSFSDVMNHSAEISWIETLGIMPYQLIHDKSFCWLNIGPILANIIGPQELASIDTIRPGKVKCVCSATTVIPAW